MKKLVIALIAVVVSGCNKGASTNAGFDENSIPSIIAALENEDEFTRQRAAIALTSKGPEATEAVGALVRVLRKESETSAVRAEAAKALGAIGSKDQAVIDVLTEFSTYRQDRPIRDNSKEALAKLQQ
jgi:HEAT repeat protein